MTSDPKTTAEVTPKEAFGTTAKAAAPKPDRKYPAALGSEVKTAAPEPAVTKTTNIDLKQVMKKPDLIAAVVEKSGKKKGEVKPVLEAALAVLGEAITEGKELNLPPFGKLKPHKTKETVNARVVIAKIRQPKANAAAKEAPKEPSEPSAEATDKAAE